uniref:Uncharacterized protein n=1 Tax=Anguilla anguilla TaxID=7936 RepID=A0A0E9Q0V8_ANGAN
MLSITLTIPSTASRGSTAEALPTNFLVRSC